MSIYEKTNVARALLYWAKNNNGNEAYYLEDRMYAVADGDMVIILTADSYDEAVQKANGERPQGEIATNCNQIATKLQQTQGDCISRSALKKSIEEYRSLNCVSTSTIIGVRNVVYLIDNAPTVAPQAFYNGIVEVISKNGITTVDELLELLKGGAE